MTWGLLRHGAMQAPESRAIASSRCWCGLRRYIGDLDQLPQQVPTVEGLGIESMASWVDVHRRLKAVEAARQGRPGQLNRA